MTRFIDYNFESRFCTVAGQEMHYLDEGQGDILLMLHGNPSWSFYYRHFVNNLKNNYRCIVPDHIGMGLSAKPSEEDYPFTLDRRVDDLVALLEQLDVKEKITLIVHDWGGMIGMAYASRYPDRIKRLVIMNTAAFHLPKTESIPWQLKLSRIPLINKFLNQGLNAFCVGATMQCVTRTSMNREVKQGYLAPYDSWDNRLAVRRFVEDIPLDGEHISFKTVDHVDKNLHQFKDVPKLICWGLKDFVFDKAFFKEWQRRFPDAECHPFPDVGHYIAEDAPDLVLPLIKNFLSLHPITD